MATLPNFILAYLAFSAAAMPAKIQYTTPEIPQTLLSKILTEIPNFEKLLFEDAKTDAATPSTTADPLITPRQLLIPNVSEETASGTTPSAAGGHQHEKRIWNPETEVIFTFLRDPFVPPQSRYREYHMNVASAYLNRMEELEAAMGDPLLWAMMKERIAQGEVNAPGALYTMPPTPVTKTLIDGPTRLDLGPTETPLEEVETIERIQRRTEATKLNPWATPPGPWSLRPTVEPAENKYVIELPNRLNEPKGLKPIYFGFPNSLPMDEEEEEDLDEDLEYLEDLDRGEDGGWGRGCASRDRSGH